MKKTNCILLLCCLLAVVFTACKKGDTGPQGAAGKDGTANIQTFPMSTSSSSWSLWTNDSSYNATLVVPAITQRVLEAGTVQVFIGNGNGTDWTAMPWSYGATQYNFDYEVGKVNIYVTLSDFSSPGNPGNVPFKVVVIPPAARLGTASAAISSTETVFYVH